MSRKFSIQPGWSLFLDRDGVINQRLADDYVKLPDEFRFISGVPEALAKLALIFSPIVVVTNQQGVGKGLMTTSQLDSVHLKMLEEITQANGRIDAVYFSPDLKKSNSFTRKPSIGMGLKARTQFPAINFKKSIMVGDSVSDIHFGHRLGMVTVLIGNDRDAAFQCSGILDYTFPDLLSFADFIQANCVQL